MLSLVDIWPSTSPPFISYLHAQSNQALNPPIGHILFCFPDRACFSLLSSLHNDNNHNGNTSGNDKADGHNPSNDAAKVPGEFSAEGGLGVIVDGGCPLVMIVE